MYVAAHLPRRLTLVLPDCLCLVFIHLKSAEMMSTLVRAELLQMYFSSFEDGIANAISSFK